jgi:hypothetical protein
MFHSGLPARELSQTAGVRPAPDRDLVSPGFLGPRPRCRERPDFLLRAWRPPPLPGGSNLAAYGENCRRAPMGTHPEIFFGNATPRIPSCRRASNDRIRR